MKEGTSKSKLSFVVADESRWCDSDRKHTS
jgi:hypothetical protein